MVLPAAWEVAGDPEGAFTPSTLAGPAEGTALGAGEDEVGELSALVVIEAVMAVCCTNSCLATTSKDSLKCWRKSTPMMLKSTAASRKDQV